ncbi:MAG: 5-(carboxyamino)imidazole ribonucleotide synthase [Alphaproteobacteria bacterium]|nr:5-(carboxyamino)imidazole ribonucleotide synthase [Alphaproteobacteria bacterium]
MLLPGSTIGIVGGGQLGRMTAMAAARLGYHTHVFANEDDAPAVQVSSAATIAPFSDTGAVARFAAAIDVATCEFENVPVAVLRRVAARKPVSPSPAILETVQDRLREKNFLRSIGVATTEFREIAGPDALAAATAELGRPAVLKTVRFGYDGKGQVLLTPEMNLDEAWRRMGATLGILEGFVDFRCEASVIVARGADGACAAYPAVENRHVNHILDTTIAPATIEPELATEAEAIARHVAEQLGLVGVLAVEMFVTKSGGILVNELAARPHNSGHWTIDACMTSQFEQLVRAICGLPLGSTDRHSDAVMTNLIGRDVADWRAALDEPNAKLHLYGKSAVRPGRKMGHITRLLPRSSGTP